MKKGKKSLMLSSSNSTSSTRTSVPRGTISWGLVLRCFPPLECHQPHRSYFLRILRLNLSANQVPHTSYVEAVALHVVVTVTVTRLTLSPVLWSEETFDVHCGSPTRCSFGCNCWCISSIALCWVVFFNEVADPSISLCCTKV